uniref:Low density lipoprotein receptor adapter protein 1-A-like isoform X1 n=1 Tax=Diabrotica virgifera virgifera TaxID=50390 RepID=A0A6P7FWD1_DIAVI
MAFSKINIHELYTDNIKFLEELSEELFSKITKEPKQENVPENDANTFKLKYIGCTTVEKVTGDNVSSEAVKTIIKNAKKLKGKTLANVTLHISEKGVIVTDAEGNDVLKISIYSISNCSTDSSHRQLFSFISSDTNQVNTCHAFLCPKRKVAQNVTLAVASAFSTAYLDWSQHTMSSEGMKNTVQSKENEKNNLNQINKSEVIIEEKLIDFDSEPTTEDDLFTLESQLLFNKNDWVSFDDDGFADPSKLKFFQ